MTRSGTRSYKGLLGAGISWKITHTHRRPLVTYAHLPSRETVRSNGVRRPLPPTYRVAQHGITGRNNRRHRKRRSRHAHSTRLPPHRHGPPRARHRRRHCQCRARRFPGSTRGHDTDHYDPRQKRHTARRPPLLGPSLRSFPSLTQRVMVLGSTRNRRAASAGVSICSSSASGAGVGVLHGGGLSGAIRGCPGYRARGGWWTVVRTA